VNSCKVRYEEQNGSWNSKYSFWGVVISILVRSRYHDPYVKLAEEIFDSPIPKDSLRNNIMKVLPTVASECDSYIIPMSTELAKNHQPKNHASICPSALLAVDSTYLYSETPKDYGLQHEVYLSHKHRHGLKLMVFIYLDGTIAGISGPSVVESEDEQFMEAYKNLNVNNVKGIIIVDRAFGRTNNMIDYINGNGIKILRPHSITENLSFSNLEVCIFILYLYFVFILKLSNNIGTSKQSYIVC